MARLLEPADVEALHEPCEFDGFLGRPAAIGIHGEQKVRAGGFARRRDALRIFLR